MAQGYTSSDIIEALGKLGIGKGDSIFVHSALRSLGKFLIPGESNKLDELLKAFIGKISEEGTITVPAFNFSFCEGEPFDVQSTPGVDMGAFSEFLRVHPRSKRTKHPFHSISALGKYASLIEGSIGETEFSEGSFFDTLLKLNTKVIFFGVPFVETFVHIAEERALVNYRFWKTFSGNFTDLGKTEWKLFKFYARKLELNPQPRVDVDKINLYLREKKIIKSTRLGEGEISVCSSNEMVEELMGKFKSDPSFPLMTPT